MAQYPVVGDHRQVSSGPKRRHRLLQCCLSGGIAKCLDMYQLKNDKPSCISLQAESACSCPAPKWALKKCLTLFSHAQTEETCPSREGQHKAFLHCKPCGGTLLWERVAEGNCPELSDTEDQVCGGSTLQIHLCFSFHEAALEDGATVLVCLKSCLNFAAL